MSKKSNNDSQEPQESPDLLRRDFLRLGVALATAGTLTSAASAASGPAASSPAKGVASSSAKVALGYWPTSSVPVPGQSPTLLAAGDPTFEQSGANLVIYGNRSNIAGQRQALLLDFFPGVGNGAALTVLAWAAGEAAMGASETVPNQPGSTGMQMPVQTVRGTLNLTADFAGTLSSFALSTGAARGAAKLQSGIYVVAAPAPGSSTPPDLMLWMWKPSNVAGNPGRLVPTPAALLPRPIAANAITSISSAPSFPYLVVEVSYGTLG